MAGKWFTNPARKRNAAGRRRPGKATLLAALLLVPFPVAAKTPAVVVTADAQLRFGAMVVVSSGWRRVGVDGSVAGGGIMPVGTGGTGPAQFTVGYDRGNEGNKPISVTIEVVLVSVPTASINGITGRLSGLQTDLPGFPNLVPGQVMTISVPNCTSRVCGKTFRVGGRVDIDRSSGEGTLAFALPVAATLVAVN